jgi:recombination protein RecT
MENHLTSAQPITTKDFFARADVRKKFDEMMGKRAPQFITSVLQIAASNELLAKADPVSIYNSAALAATLDLPLNNNLGFAYIVPYNAKQKDGTYKVVAQFQMGYKGFIQLAQRSGQFKTISATPIYDGQLVEMNPLTGFVFDFTKKSDKIIGYASYFSLINGFEKIMYMPIEEVQRHAGKFSQTYKKGFGLWKDEFDSMATKTVLKLLLSKFAPLSVEMQKAVMIDQSVIKDDNANEVEYADHEDVTIDKEAERVRLLIESSKDARELTQSMQGVTMNAEQTELFTKKMESFNTN